MHLHGDLPDPLSQLCFGFDALEVTNYNSNIKYKDTIHIYSVKCYYTNIQLCMYVCIRTLV